eukprot:CAMPEP_0195296006 /NCGR_PEP_ID=MMETSP0707-20130614/18587_1 /TAXON_ID=33640 /ORGANISM="Asterionellopsis glacialis, Strain CCMP134" /LENGTH=243 /DNA_ID=CAMNT_0040357377 /DNA_START=23 /DNA_END=751 /DNA_ORIENTATION=+
MVFTKTMFSDEARTLVKAWETVQDDNDAMESGDKTNLDRWQIATNDSHGSDGDIYLVHPAIRRHTDTVANEESCKQRSLGDDDNDDVLTGDYLEDDTIDTDCDTVLSPQRASTSKDNSAMGNEWRFSVVYSDTWRVPVLYFTVQKLNDGSPCLRTEVLHSLQIHGKHKEVQVVGDTWDFVSSEEHPITGIPSFFLHPCQTSERLELLLHSGKAASEQGKTSSPFLLSWMSMIFPAVGIYMSPK